MILMPVLSYPATTSKTCLLNEHVIVSSLMI
jgi:hypothetical protein